MGILLGLLAMWIVFDLLGGVRTADPMVLQQRRSIRLMAELQELSLSPEAAHIARRMESIREELISNFAAVNTEADAVLLEAGAERREHLALRERGLSMQPWLRSLLLLQVSALQYRRERPRDELPPPIAEAQRCFDEAVALQLRRLATNLRLERAETVQSAFHGLRDEIYRYY